MWVPFNEAWGQFKTRGDRPSGPRLTTPRVMVNAASGGNFYPDAGEVLDIHQLSPSAFLRCFDIGRRERCIGEYGGIGLAARKGTSGSPTRTGDMSVSEIARAK